MPTLASKLNPRSEDFKANAAAMRSLVDDLNAKLERIAQGGGEGPRFTDVSAYWFTRRREGAKTRSWCAD